MTRVSAEQTYGGQWKGRRWQWDLGCLCVRRVVSPAKQGGSRRRSRAQASRRLLGAMEQVEAPSARRLDWLRPPRCHRGGAQIPLPFRRHRKARASHEHLTTLLCMKPRSADCVLQPHACHSSSAESVIRCRELRLVMVSRCRSFRDNFARPAARSLSLWPGQDRVSKD